MKKTKLIITTILVASIGFAGIEGIVSQARAEETDDMKVPVSYGINSDHSRDYELKIVGDDRILNVFGVTYGRFEDNYHKLLVNFGHEFNNWGLVLGFGARFRSTSEYTLRERMPFIDYREEAGIPFGSFPYPMSLYPAYPYDVFSKYEQKLMFRGAIYKTISPLYVSAHVDRYGRKNSIGGSIGLNIEKFIAVVRNIFRNKN